MQSFCWRRKGSCGNVHEIAHAREKPKSGHSVDRVDSGARTWQWRRPSRNSPSLLLSSVQTKLPCLTEALRRGTSFTESIVPSGARTSQQFMRQCPRNSTTFSHAILCTHYYFPTLQCMSAGLDRSDPLSEYPSEGVARADVISEATLD